MSARPGVFTIFALIMISLLLHGCSSLQSKYKKIIETKSTENFTVYLHECSEPYAGTAVNCYFSVSNRKGKASEVWLHRKSIRGETILNLKDGRTSITASSIRFGNKKGKNGYFGAKVSPGYVVRGVVSFKDYRAFLKDVASVKIALSRTVLHKAEYVYFRDIFK